MIKLNTERLQLIPLNIKQLELYLEDPDRLEQELGVTVSRTVLTEVLQNEEFRQSIEKLWHRHVWQPMVESLEGLQANGVIRKDVDVEVLARAIHCLHIGYFLVRHVFAPDRNWDDPAEIEKMAEILTRGSSDARRA